jgi:hypothetical protein
MQAEDRRHTSAGGFFGYPTDRRSHRLGLAESYTQDHLCISIEEVS